MDSSDCRQPPAMSATVTAKKLKPIPPPLDLRVACHVDARNAPRTAIPIVSVTSPYHQKNLPFRKRAFSWSNVKLGGGLCASGPDVVSSAGDDVRPQLLAEPDSRPLVTPTALLSPAHSQFSSAGSGGHDETPRFLFPPPGCSPSAPAAAPHTSIWHMFQPGTRISVCEAGWPPVRWCCVEDLVAQDSSAAPYGLLVRAVHRTSTEPGGSFTVRLQPVLTGQPEFLAACLPLQPFYVQHHGWSSVFPQSSLEPAALPFRQLREGDVCVAANSPRATSAADHHQQLLAPSSVHTPPGSPAARHAQQLPNTAGKVKRPMNGFMLFAKKNRVELINQHPGKDNRAISVMLGETWKTLPQPERDCYTHEARLMAEEKKRIFPDCWKRKRSNSAS